MTWWHPFIEAYIIVSYIAGLLIIFLYSVGLYTISRGGRLGILRVEATSPEDVGPIRKHLIYFLIFWILSPLFVPWWFVSYYKANRGG